jgi:TupA-like ATPgrasp
MSGKPSDVKRAPARRRSFDTQLTEAAMFLVRAAYRAFRSLLPLKWKIILDFQRAHGCLPDLKRPKTFNEKMACRKLYDRDPRIPPLMDKIKVKDYISVRYGADLIIPTLATYDSVSELNFEKPPLCTPPYVIKINRGSGLNMFIKDDLDPDVIRKQLQTWLKLNFSKETNEWGYAPIKLGILVEPFIGGLAQPTDYKFHVFSGTIYAIEVVQGRFCDYRINFYDRHWRQLDIKRYAGRPGSDRPVPPPKSLARMLGLAESMGKDFSYVRVDLYEIEGQPKFGELSFYAGSAYDQFEPAKWDAEFGEQWS